MFRYLLCLIAGLVLTKGQALCQTFSINAPLIADGGICTPFDTASFTATITINAYQNQAWYMDFNFGDGSIDTFAFVTNNFSGTYIFRGSHVYQSNGTFPVKVYARDNANVIRDSIITAVTIGNCQKASGIVYHDYISNCLKDAAEAPLASQYYRFYRNGVLERAYLDAAGRFKIPVYTGDTILPQSGSIQPFTTSATPCGTATFPPITGAVSNYNIALKEQNYVHQLTYFCPDADTMVCIGTGYVYMPFGINADQGWYIRMDYGDGNVFGPDNYYTGIPDQTHTYTTPGMHTAKIHLYDQNHYGPVMTMEKTFNVVSCHPVKVDLYSDNNNNCQVDSGEYHYDMNSSYAMEMYSVARNGSNPYTQNADGSVTSYIWPGDTVYRAPFLSVYSTVPPFLQFLDIPERNCAPGYITEAVDSIAFAYHSKMKITNTEYSYSGNCIGDTLFFQITAASVGIMPGTPLRLRCLYGDGKTDTFNFAPLVTDTFSQSFTKYVMTADLLDYTFIVEKADGTAADTTYGVHNGANCAIVTLRTYYDENRNCVKDTNEAYLTHYSIQNSTPWTNIMVQDSITTRVNAWVGDALQQVSLSAGSPLGAGIYTRTYTAPLCSWPVFAADTGSFDVPLVDTIRIQNGSLVNYLSATLESPAIPACDSVFHPVLKCNVYGNRNAANPPYFVYHNGNGGTDTAVITTTDNYSELNFFYRATAPNSTYPYGTYVPGYEVRRTDDNFVYQYVHNLALQVTHNCETPKARLFIDLDANCIKNTADPALNNLTVAATVNGVPVNAATDNNGNVFFNAANGSLVTITVPQTLATGQVLSAGCTTGNTISYTYTSGAAVNNFPYSCTAASNDYSILAGHHYLMAGVTDTIYLYPQHTGCGTGTAVLSLVLDPALNFIAASRSGVSVSGQTLSWNITNMATLGAAPVKVAVSLNGSVPAGTGLCNTASLLPATPDANPGNNVFVLCDSVFSAPQPLLKTGLSDSLFFQPGLPIVYAIHFQNTTASAVQQVVVLDTLSSLLDIGSLSVLYASHNYNTAILNNNVLKFTFPAIQLQPGNSGMIQFSVNASGSLIPGTVITNRAAVAYNYQQPALTNMAMSALMPPVPLSNGLKDIRARHDAGVNNIDWTMATVHSGSYFELERSSDGVSFTYLGKVTAVQQRSAYRYSDLQPFKGTSFYRLKLSGADGKLSYSPVVTATWNPGNDFLVDVYPNPAKHSITIKVNGTTGQHPEVTVSDLSGRVLARAVLVHNEATIPVNGWANGVYLLRYADASHTQTVKISKE